MTVTGKSAKGAVAEPGALGPIERRTLQETAYQRLKQALLSGHLEPGRVLSLRKLALDLGTSVMPVRDAIGRLVSERALELLPNRGLRVPTLSDAQAAEVWRLRIQLEGEAAGLAASERSDAELAQIRASLDRLHALARPGSLHAMLDANSELQFAVYRASHSDLLVTMIETLRMRCAPHCTAAFRRLLAEQHPFLKETLGYDDAIVDAIARRDARGATLAKRRDLERLRAWVDACGRGAELRELPASRPPKSTRPRARRA
jgi:DNA-binding GntR family transcriptional regulator